MSGARTSSTAAAGRGGRPAMVEFVGLRTRLRPGMEEAYDDGPC